MSQLGGNNNVDFRGMSTDAQQFLISLKTTFIATKHVIMVNKKKLLGKMIITVFVLAILFIGININFPIKKDLCQNDVKCLKQQDTLMIIAVYVALIMISGMIIYSYLKFYRHINKLILKTIGFIQVPFIVIPITVATYIMYRIVSKKLNIGNKLFYLFKYIVANKFNQAWQHMKDPETLDVWYHYGLFYIMVLLIIVSIVIPAVGIKLVPIGKLIWFWIMLVLVFMWIPAIDYVFGVVDMNDDHKVSKLFSSGLYVVYPISFLISFYFVALILFHLIFVGKFSTFF